MKYKCKRATFSENNKQGALIFLSERPVLLFKEISEECENPRFVSVCPPLSVLAENHFFKAVLASSMSSLADFEPTMV